MYSKLPEHIFQPGSEYEALYTVLNRFRLAVLHRDCSRRPSACIFSDRLDAFASPSSRIEDAFLRTDLQGAFSSALV
jgi:hypothetical protein